MPEVVQKILWIAWTAMLVGNISRDFVYRTDNRATQTTGIFLSIGIVAALVARLTNKLPRSTRVVTRARRHVVKPGGNWLGAPVPEVDKSTTGQLLAGRLRRNPEIQLDRHPAPAEPASAPPRRDALWDRDLDGGL